MTKWKLVPCEPTPEMAAVFIPESCKTGSWIDGYKAMLNAAPAPDVQPVAFRFKERPDDLRSAWLYVDKKKNVPRGFNCQHLYIIPQTKRNEEPVAWSIARVIEDDDGRPIGQDEPEVVWGRDRPDEDGFTPLYARPPAAPAPDVQPIAYLYHDARIPEEAHPWLHSTMLVLAPDRRPERCGETPLYLHPPAADMQELVEALQRIVNEVPAGDGCGGFFIEHCDQDGNYIGTESVNPFDVALSLHSIAQEALAKWEKK